MEYTNRDRRRVQGWVTRGIKKHGSMRALAAVMGVHDKTVKNWRDGVNEPFSKHYLWLEKNFGRKSAEDDNG